MYGLYEAMNHRKSPPIPEEIDLASGATVMDAAAAVAYIGKVEAATANIVKMFEAQSRAAMVRLANMYHFFSDILIVGQ